MPIYEFTCTDCAATRDLQIPIASRDTIEPLCHECGGDMRRHTVHAVHLTGTVAQQDAQAESGAKAKSCGHVHHCRCNSVKLKRENPFKKDIEAAAEQAQSGSAA